MQFNNEDELSMELTISDELLAQKNEKVSEWGQHCYADASLVIVRVIRLIVALLFLELGMVSPEIQASVLCFGRWLLHAWGDGGPLYAVTRARMQLLSVSLAQCGGKLQRTMSGKINTVFAHILRGLSGAKITRAKEEVFRNMSGGGCCVRCSYKADDGFLYPLDKAFFYVHKPPMCINHR